MVKEEVITKVKTNSIIEACQRQKLSCAVFRHPQSNTAFVLISDTERPQQQPIDFETCLPGFVMAPFHALEAPYFLPADFLAPIDSMGCIDLNFYWKNKLQIEITPAENQASFTLAASKPSFELESRDSYIEKVRAIMNNLDRSKCSKVVLSRIKRLGCLQTKNYYDGFKNLSRAFPNAFVSFVYLPWKKQIWMGASPETLIFQDGKGIFKTVALAGTQGAFDSNGKAIELAEALWSQKEIEEQALVSRYIINCLKKIRVREFEEKGPKTIKAGNLLHLNTTFSIQTQDIDFPNLSSVMLNLLHPTPAVCGMPKEEALTLLNQHEDYDREFYSGFLGTVNIDNFSHLFVNIRCMKIENNTVYGYAGGGLTPDSNPEKEWNETELKLQTIQKAFENL
jgi:isochorismate synthase